MASQLQTTISPIGVSGIERIRLSRPVPRMSTPGFTLVELLLILALLTVLAAVAWPEVAHLYAQREIKQAGHFLQHELLTARVGALRHATLYECRFEIGGRKYSIRPSSEVSSSPSFDRSEPRTQRDQEPTGTLPLGLRFTGLHQGDTRPVTGRHTRNTGDYRSLRSRTGASELVVFYPDGTATRGELAIEDNHGNIIRIIVDRLTGSVRTAPIEKTP